LQFQVFSNHALLDYINATKTERERERKDDFYFFYLNHGYIVPVVLVQAQTNSNTTKSNVRHTATIICIYNILFRTKQAINNKNITKGLLDSSSARFTKHSAHSLSRKI